MVDKDTQERWDQEDRAKYLKRAGRAMRLAQSKAWARGENPSGYTSVRRRPDSYRSTQIKGRDDV